MTHPLRYKAAKKVTWVSAITNSLLAIFKIVVGTVGFSQALIADGLHSFSDLISDFLVLFAAKAATRGADKEHPYGHQRIETIATILIALLLFAVGASIVYEAITRFVSDAPFQTPSIYVLIVAAVSILANEALYRYSVVVGRKVESNLIVSNAWHNRTDAFVSLLVLLSAVCALLGWHHIDGIAAILIAFFIMKMGGKMIWSSVRELIDTGVDEDTLNKIISVINQCNGVRSVHQLRTRMHGSNIFVDVHIIVDPTISVSEGHYIGEQVHLTLVKNFKHISDVTVHIDPEDDENSMPSINLPNREEITEQLNHCWCNLPGFKQSKKLTLHYLDGKLHIELTIPLAAAQGKSASDLEHEYHNAAKTIKDIADVKIHYE